MSFGTFLKNERKKHKGLTQQKLAELSGLSRTYISDVENDRYSPSIKFIQKVHEAIVNYGSLRDIESLSLYNNLVKEAGLGSQNIRDTLDNDTDTIQQLSIPDDNSDKFSKSKANKLFIQILSWVRWEDYNYYEISLVFHAFVFLESFSEYDVETYHQTVDEFLKRLNHTTYTREFDKDSPEGLREQLKKIDALINDDSINQMLWKLRSEVSDKLKRYNQ